MSNDNFPLTLVVVSSMLVATVALFGIASLWATNRRVGWFARVAPITILLAALLPIGMFDLAIVLAMEAAFVIGGVWLVRGVRSWRKRRKAKRLAAAGELSGEAEPSRSWVPRFGLFDLLKAVALGAVVLAIARLASDEWGGTDWSSPVNWAQALAVGAILALLVWAGQGLARVRGWWGLLIPVFLVLAVAGAIPWVQGKAPIDLLIFFEPAWGWLALVAVLQALAVATWQHLLATAGWDWWTESKTTGELMADAATDSPRGHRIGTFVARAALCGLALVCLLPLADAYRGLLPPRDVPVVTLPKPNGYEELVRAAGLVNWNSCPSGDAEGSSAAQCAQFVQDNGPALAVFREALTMPSQAPVDYSYMSAPALTNIQRLRELCRAHTVRAKAAAAAGRPDEACQSLLDAVRMGNPMCQGGLVVDQLVADAIESVGVSELLPLLEKVDDDTLSELGRELERLLEGREPVDKVVAREQRHAMSWAGWTGRFDLWLHDRHLGGLFGFSAPVEMQTIRARRDARLKLLIVEVALHRYKLAHGALPDSLDELVPDYLASVPTDPFSDGPLRYHRTDTGYVVYSVGPNGDDDGGAAPQGDDYEQGDFLLAPP